jgi:ATP-dependent Clp protease ATP-binding subunit ClpC
MTNSEKNITKELKDIFTYIKEDLVEEYPSSTLTTEYFILAILEKKDCTAYKILSRIMLSESLNVIETWHRQFLSDNSSAIKPTNISLDKVFDKFIEVSEDIAKETESDAISSGHLLCSIFKDRNNISESFKMVSVNYEQLHKCLINYYYKQKPHKSNVIQTKKVPTSIHSDRKMASNSDNNIDRNLINYNELAEFGKVDTFIGGDELYKKVFQMFSKKQNNNVAIVGDYGIGKKTFIYNIANLIVKGNVPEAFKNKIVVKLDFNKLFVNCGIRGMFEQKMLSIIDEANTSGKYIFVIEALCDPFNAVNKTEINISSILKKLFDCKNINVITQSSIANYNCITDDYAFIRNKLYRIDFEEPSINETIDILNEIKEQYEVFHKVTYTENAIKTCINLSKEYITDKKLPSVAIDILDEIGALTNITDNTTDEIKKAETELSELIKEIENYREYGVNDINYSDVVDEYTKEEIKLRNKVSKLKKQFNLQKEAKVITEHDVRKEISKITNIPLEELDNTEKNKLRNLESTLLEEIVGQDEAIKQVCKSIKRKRLGLSAKGKPSVFMFLGATGVGKTYLAKKIAEKIFGDEKYLVRLDMSEYIDQTSCNKLIGSASGYVGYNEGGVLTNALKKKKYCVLLLDEIEKAHSDVYNMFLQMFDEGRITDNKGNFIDCKDVIVIMTSNVGAKDCAMRGNSIGFINTTDDIKKSVIDKALKNKFTPEFLNRINNIVYFNPLKEEEIKKIIKLELIKAKNRIEGTENKVDNTFLNKEMIDFIYNDIKDKKNMGARPILRSIEELIENKVVDILLNQEDDDCYTFTDKDFLTE